MAKNPKEAKGEPSVEKAAFTPTNDELVEIQALRTINTSLFGNFREGQNGKVSAALAEQLQELGEAKIVK